MSQTSKRSGARDISELKARLGLKKNNARKQPQSGVVPPPGAGNLGGVIPPPPGAQPPGPDIPDASEDPFGAMNAIAAHGAVTRQPEFVVVNDGAPVEQVNKAGLGVRIGKIAAMVLVPLAIGISVGQISSGAKQYNQTIDDAARVLEDVQAISKGIIDVKGVFDEVQPVPGETKLADALKELSLVEPNLDVVYSSRLWDMPYEIVRDVLVFYHESVSLKADITAHIAATERDAPTIKKGIEGWGAAVGATQRFAALLELPDAEQAAAGAPPTIRLVQLGNPICTGQNAPTEGCPPSAPPEKFQYRIAGDGNYGTKSVASQIEGSEGETKVPGVKANTLVRINPDTKLFQQAVKGGKASLAETAYIARVKAMQEKVDRLLEIRSVIEERLNSKKQESKKFTFFM